MGYVHIEGGEVGRCAEGGKCEDVLREGNWKMCFRRRNHGKMD